MASVKSSGCGGLHDSGTFSSSTKAMVWMFNLRQLMRRLRACESIVLLGGRDNAVDDEDHGRDQDK